MPTLNLTHELESFIAEVTRAVPELGHIDAERVLVCVASTRGGGVHGTFARIHPLRFENGSRTTVVRRRRGNVVCEITPITRQGIEMLYVIYFLVPRFLNLPLRDKLVTIFHELYHISPACDGDIRRFSGRNYAHGSSRKKYNSYIETLVDGYLARLENPGRLEFLKGDMAEIRARHGVLVGRRMPAPKLRLVRETPPKR